VKAPGRRWIGLGIGVLLLAACSENVELFSSLDEEAEPSLSTVEAGSVIAENDSLNVQIDYPSEDASRATRMVVELQAPDGTLHGSVEFGPDQLEEPELPAIQLPAPPDGVYRLVVRAWINDQPLFSEDRQIFVLDQAPEVRSLTIHPTSITGSMQALAIADVWIPSGTRPYARWLFDDSVVIEGYLSEGLDRVVLDAAGKAAGAYRAVVEVYPWGPEEGAVVDGSTTIVADADVFVRDQPDVPASPQLYDGVGTLLRHYSFDGTMQAWRSDGGAADEATVAGASSLDIRGGALGVRLSPTAALSMSVPLPDSGDGAHLVLIRLATAGDDVRPARVTVGNGTEDALDEAGSVALTAGAVETNHVVRVYLTREADGVRAAVIDTADGVRGTAYGLAVSAGRLETATPVRIVASAEDSLFVERVSVVALNDQQYRSDLASQLEEAFLARFAGLRTGVWVRANPSDRASSDTGVPHLQLAVTARAPAEAAVFLSDGGELRISSAGGWSATLRREGRSLSTTTADGGVIARVDLPESGRLMVPISLRIRAAGGADTVVSGGTGGSMTLDLPASVSGSTLRVAPAADGDLPVWVGSVGS